MDLEDIDLDDPLLDEGWTPKDITHTVPLAEAGVYALLASTLGVLYSDSPARWRLEAGDGPREPDQFHIVIAGRVRFSLNIELREHLPGPWVLIDDQAPFPREPMAVGATRVGCAQAYQDMVSCPPKVNRRAVQRAYSWPPPVRHPLHHTVQ